MEYTTLGKTDIKISRNVLGCMEMGGNPVNYWIVQDEKINLDLLQTALDNGITFFDTAEIYGINDGRSETILGKALKSVRDKVVIASKVAQDHLKPEDVEKAIEGSLKRLQTSYLDLYYIHAPNSEVPLEDTMKKMVELQKRGLIRTIGVSNFSLAQIKEAMQYGEIAALQPEYNLLVRTIEKEIMPFCFENKISIFSYNSLAKGILTGAFHLYGAILDSKEFRNKKPHFQKENLEVQKKLILLLEEIAKKHDATISQVATRWTLNRRGLTGTIIGTQNTKHFLENLGAFKFSLTEEEEQKISETSNTVIKEMKI